ncbi:MAG: hypothetical protein N2738_06670 [Thermodesulfovibrionales bacterium]|nr:hypothetical protein [Thermodesulfovibrionales bacterium]
MGAEEMHNSEINLSILSEEAKKELIDFYLFLVEKHGKTKVKKVKRFEKLIANPLIVKNLAIPSRDQLYER